MFYNNIKDYIYVNPTNDYVDDFQVYKYIQKDASLFGGEIYFNKETAVDWLSSETSIEFISGKTADRENLPLIISNNNKSIVSFLILIITLLKLEHYLKAKNKTYWSI